MSGDLAAAVLVDVLVREHGARLRSLRAWCALLAEPPADTCGECQVLDRVPVAQWALCNRTLPQTESTFAGWVVRCHEHGSDGATDENGTQYDGTRYGERSPYYSASAHAVTCPMCGSDITESVNEQVFG